MNRKQQYLWALWARAARPRAVGNAGLWAFSTDRQRPQVFLSGNNARSFSPPTEATLELSRTVVVDRRVLALFVVETLDIIDQPAANATARVLRTVNPQLPAAERPYSASNLLRRASSQQGHPKMIESSRSPTT